MRSVLHANKQTNIPLAALLLMIIVLVFQNLSLTTAAAQSHIIRQSHLGGQRIPGHLVPLLKDSKPIGPTPRGMLIHLAIALHLRNQATLDTLLAAQNDPTSPLYHQYLTPQSFVSQFGPTQTTVDTVTRFLRQQQMQVTSIASNHVLIDAVATVATTEQAFALTLNNYQLQGRVVYAPATDPLIPADLVDKIADINGLDNVAIYHPLTIQSSHQQTHSHRGGPADGFTPDKLRTAYDIQPLLKTGADGTGQTIGLFELDGYTPSDITTYLHQYNLGAPRFSNVLIDGAQSTPGHDALEVELDMETMSAIAPGANQKVYIGPNSPQGVSDIYNRIVADDVAKVISISWGSCELASVPAWLDALDSIFKEGAAQGQAFFAASGDTGAYDCNDNNFNMLAVDFPASDPYVVGVGGTTLHTDADGTYHSESAWNGTGRITSAGGGGKSAHFLRPNYQNGTNLTDPYRMVPDVSANADPTTGYAIYSTVNESTGWGIVGGTSAAAPLWAGIAADINQFLDAQHLAGLGNALVALYQLYNVPQIYTPYHDVMTGSNRYYQAGPGYDQATGMGTPDTWNMARDLESTSAVPSQLLSNPGFEDGPTAWQEHSSGNYELITTANPHAGKYSAYLCGYAHCDDSITQTILLPTSTQKVTLSYWLYIGRGVPGTTCQDTLHVYLRTVKGTPISTVQKLCNTDANGWVQYTFDVTSDLKSYIGQLVQVVFEAAGISGQKANFFVNVDDMTLLALGNSPGITNQLIQNQSFENGQAPWQELAKSGDEIISTAIPHTGTYSAYLCGYTNCNDTIFQTVTLPSATQKETLSYWVYIGRADPSTSCQDTFHVYLRTVTGAPIATIQKLCNTDANGWVQYTFDVSLVLIHYAGQKIQVAFQAIGIGGQRANFFVNVDDVALLVTHT